MDLNPIKYSDMYGDTIISSNDLPDQWPDFNPATDQVQLNTVTVKSSNDNRPNNNAGASNSSGGSVALTGVPMSPGIPLNGPAIPLPRVRLPSVVVPAPNPILLVIMLIFLPQNYGQPSSDYAPVRPVIVPAYIPPPKSLPGFPDAIREKPKANRKRWRLPDGRILEWDYQHGKIEMYDKTGRRHQGEYDPTR
ncbi:colicin E3/pyocin S6 family cytotoxin [Chitinophaga defluvii]|uniref:Colicin E3/pyocin S6 family cytotoxin n=1 Tax=Chitinophaga defluvii TaxID=3163343 RepID=A0ABV2TEV7_9BACT